MPVKLTVLYPSPDDESHFEKHYTGVHVGLSRQVPGLQRFESARVVGTPDGSPPSYYRVAELTFADLEALRQAYDSEAGREAADDVRNLCPDGARMLICELDEHGLDGS